MLLIGHGVLYISHQRLGCPGNILGEVDVTVDKKLSVSVTSGQRELRQFHGTPLQQFQTQLDGLPLWVLGVCGGLGRYQDMCQDMYPM